MIYLSIAQDVDWKYGLLHKATYLMYSLPGLHENLARSQWPASDALIRTLYLNTENAGKLPSSLDLSKERALSQAEPPTDVPALMTTNKREVHFKSIVFYNMYTEPGCGCNTRSWCLPQWTRYLTNQSLDIYMVGREPHKPVYWIDDAGCTREISDVNLQTHYISRPFDVSFVFEINAFMNPEQRILSPRRAILYPAFNMTPAHTNNFNYFGVSVLEDDAVLKLPNPGMRRILNDAYSDIVQRDGSTQKTHTLLYPAEIRRLKGQVEFLWQLRGAFFKNKWLKKYEFVFVGDCMDQQYCDELVDVGEILND